MSLCFQKSSDTRDNPPARMSNKDLLRLCCFNYICVTCCRGTIEKFDVFCVSHCKSEEKKRPHRAESGDGPLMKRLLGQETSASVKLYRIVTLSTVNKIPIQKLLSFPAEVFLSHE